MSRTATIPISARLKAGMPGAVAPLLQAWGRRGVAAVLLTLSLVLWGEGVPGDLDPTSGLGGTVITDFDFLAEAFALVLQPDGKLVAAGDSCMVEDCRRICDFALARYLPDGRLDPTFGVGGQVTTDFGGSDTASALILQPDGKLVAAGSSVDPSNGSGDFALARYLPDGSLDATFGTGFEVADTIPPVVTISANPATLWPPNGKLVPVTVSGTMTDEPGGSGVNASSAAYKVADEYGQIQPSVSITLGVGGSYAFTISLQASRDGNDQDGRHYTITVSAKDNAGNLGASSTIVTVPHDQGQ
jgi:uncharacterized delta-60 repeat protein